MGNYPAAGTRRRMLGLRRVLYLAAFAVSAAAAATVVMVGGGGFRIAGGVAGGLLLGYGAAVGRYRKLLTQQVAAARRDTLTGLPTRAVIDQMLEAATRAGTPVSVALADVDGLHAVNANLGHAAGDQYIQLIARRLTRAVPPGGVLCRQGGDEFTIVAPHVNAEQLATSIGVAMAGPATIGGFRLQPRASVGVAQSLGGDANYTRACADAAEHTAKARGGNHILTYQPDRDGRPRPDGTRPLLRRRDIDPGHHKQVAWTPAPGDGLLPVLWTPEEAAIVHAALLAAAQQCRQDGRPGSDAAYLTGLADRLARIIDAAQPY